MNSAGITLGELVQAQEAVLPPMPTVESRERLLFSVGRLLVETWGTHSVERDILRDWFLRESSLLLPPWRVAEPKL